MHVCCFKCFSFQLQIKRYVYMSYLYRVITQSGLLFMKWAHKLYIAELVSSFGYPHIVELFSTFI